MTPCFLKLNNLHVTNSNFLTFIKLFVYREDLAKEDVTKLEI